MKPVKLYPRKVNTVLYMQSTVRQAPAMFTHATPSSPTLATTTSPASPLSPSRPSRLRGLSYLRNYTHSLHSHSRDNSTSSTSPSARHSWTRATSYLSTSPPTASPGFESPLTAAVTASPHPSPTLQRSTTAQSTNNTTSHDTSPSTSGWLPTVGGHSGASSSALLSNPSVIPENSVVGRARSASAAVREAGSDISEMNGGTNPQLYDSPPPSAPALGPESRPTIRFSQHQDARAPRPSLTFSPMGRTLPTGKEIIRVGRYSERETQPNQPANLSTAAPVGFKSKVVSRRHCEFWTQDGVWYVKDVKSSSGTFLNHVRLSSPGTESKPFPVKDGDIVQLGIDFKGGEEMIFRCVKIRIELNRAWQAGLNSFKYVFLALDI